MEKITIGNCTLYNADCRDVLPELGRFDLLLTDPPYGIGINKSNRLSISRGHTGFSWDDEPVDPDLLNSIFSKSDTLIVWGGNYFDLPPAKCFIIWDKQNDGRDFADCEYAWTNLDKVARIHRQRPMNMDGGKEHPTQKPIRLMQFCIHQADKKSHNATIFDPFMGSGSTAMACILEGRTFTGIEREPRYFDAACERIERATAQGRLFTDA